MLVNYLDRSVQGMIALFGGEFSEYWIDYKNKKEQDIDVADVPGLTALMNLIRFALLQVEGKSEYNKCVISAFIYSVLIDNDEFIWRYDRFRQTSLAKVDELVNVSFVQRRQHPYLLDVLNSFKQRFG